MNDQRSPWIRLPLVLAAAFLLRALVALNTDQLMHADELFQYLEQGHRLAFGYGYKPWEYSFGIRSWLIPGFIAGLLHLAARIGLDSPTLYGPAVKLVFCAISLALPLSLYHIGRSLFSEAVGRLSCLAGTVWYEAVYMAHKPLADALGAYCALGALAVLLCGQSRVARLAFGLLAGLVIGLRFPFLPLVAVLLLLSLWRWRRGALTVAASLSLTLLAVGALDAYTWNVWFSSIINNWALNIGAGVARSFGSEPLTYYLTTLMVSSAGLALVGAIGLGLTWRRSWPLLICGLAVLVPLSLIGHKEQRFVFVLIPLMLIGLAVAADGIWRAVRRRWKPAVWPQGLLAPLFVLTLLVPSAAGAKGRIPGQWRLQTAHVLQQSDAVQAYLWLSRQGDVTGIIDGTVQSCWSAPGFYTLHLDIPVYCQSMPVWQTVRLRPARFASHWILPSGTAASPDFRPVHRQGEMVIWHRRVASAHTVPLIGYSRVARSAPGKVALPAGLQPRW